MGVFCVFLDFLHFVIISLLVSYSRCVQTRANARPDIFKVSLDAHLLQTLKLVRDKASGSHVAVRAAVRAAVRCSVWQYVLQ
mmetsp:Transcript_54384/g.88059  ORF Transcript_54384/g.88059 Transcript_54384/m.88059 type:complete len:82 (-) Transcript_54384:1135-1380(-)